jgi:hypothetical protein
VSRSSRGGEKLLGEESWNGQYDGDANMRGGIATLLFECKVLTEK